MRYFLIVLVLILGCQPPSTATVLQNKETENGWEIELLFKHDGCKVYRFYDMGYRYFVVRDSVEAEFINQIHTGDSDNPPKVETTPTLNSNLHLRVK